MPITAKGDPKGWVVGQGEDGPFIDENGDPAHDIASAEVHGSEIEARTFARRRTAQQLPGGTWQAIPLPSTPAEEPEDEPYDQIHADAHYALLPKRRS